MRLLLRAGLGLSMVLATLKADSSLAQTTAAFTEFVAGFETAIKKAGGTELFEGLPHPFERELLAAEKKRASTVRLHGELFYATAQPVDAQAAEKLRVTLVAAARPYRGMKACGGFHADYALRWRTDAGRFDALVCFGCHEMKLYTKSGELTTDLSIEGFEALRPLFAPFRKERPAREVAKKPDE